MSTESLQPNQDTQTPNTAIVANKYGLWFKLTIIFGAVAVFLVGFLAGQTFGQARERHLAGWQNNYGQNFNFPPRGVPFDEHPNAFSVIGKILVIQDNRLAIEGRNKVEQTALLDDKTAFRKGNTEVKKDELKIDQNVAVFGEPNNDGQIKAKLIRIFENNENPLP